MANKKKLQEAAIKFRKENQLLHHSCSVLLSRMANFIKNNGAIEVIVGFKNGEYYEQNN